MSKRELENTLRDLPRIGTLVKDRGYRQIWRFEYQDKPYYLKFYPHRGLRLKRLFRGGSPAMHEFVRLQWLQRAGVPSPRASAVLMGFKIEDQTGDALITEGIEPARPLDVYLNELQLRGEPVPEHRRLVEQVIAIVQQLALARLGHRDLHLGNFLLGGQKLYLMDAYAVRRGGPHGNDVMLLAHSARPHVTLTDLQRGWETLGPGGRMPPRNPLSPALWRKDLSKSAGDNRYFGRLRTDGWSGHFFRQAKYPKRWSQVSQMQLADEDWQKAWPILLRQIEQDRLTVIKRTRSGDVLKAEVDLGGRSVPVIVKRPKKKHLHRYVTEIGRGVRARRAWKKAWMLVARNVPTAWPMLTMERRTLGYVTDALIVFERIPGQVLSEIDLDRLPAGQRDRTFRRAGRLLRRIERSGLYPADAKSSNWLVRPDEKLGPTPMLIDVDGLRSFEGRESAIHRLLRSMRQHAQYTPADSLAICQGYAPYAPIHQEEPAYEQEPAENPGEP